MSSLIKSLVFLIISTPTISVGEVHNNETDVSFFESKICKNIEEFRAWDIDEEDLIKCLNKLEQQPNKPNAVISMLAQSAESNRVYVDQTGRTETRSFTSRMHLAAYALARNYYGDFHFELMKYIENAAWAFLDDNDVAKARELLKKWNLIGSKNQVDPKVTLYLSGALDFEQTNYHEAARKFKIYLNFILNDPNQTTEGIAKFKLDYANLLYELGTFGEAKKLLKSALAEAKSQRNFDLTYDIYSSLQEFYYLRNEVKEQEKILLEASAYFETFLPTSQYAWLNARTDLAYLFYRLDRYEDASTLVYSIIEYFDTFLGGPQPSGCRVFNLAGLIETYFEDYELAKTIFEKLIFEENERPDFECHSSGDVNLAGLYLEIGELSLAEFHYLEGIAKEESSGGSELHQLYLMYGDLLTYQEDRYDEAEEFYILALEANNARNDYDPSFELLVQQRLSQLFLELEDREKGLQYANATAELLVAFMENLSEGRMLTARLETYRWIAGYLGYAFYFFADEAEDDDFETLIDLGFQFSQRSHITEAQLASKKSLMRSSFIDRGFKTTFDKFRTKELELQLIQKEIDSYLMPNYRTETSATNEPQNVLAEMLRTRDSLEDQLLNLKGTQNFKTMERLSADKPISVSDMQRNLDPDEVYIFVAPTYFDDQYLIFAIYPDGWITTAVDYTLLDSERDVSVIRQSLTVTENGKLKPFASRESLNIYSKVFKDIINYTQKEYPSIQNIKYTVHGPLQNIPLALLLTDGEKDKFFSDDFTLSLVPSANFIRYVKRPQITPASSIIGFGDPDFVGERFTELRGLNFVDLGITDLHSKIKKMAPLPDTAVEVRSISSLFKTGKNKVFLGTDANEKAFLNQKYDGYDIIVVATHGVQSKELLSLEEPALLLPFAKGTDRVGYDGALTTSEISALDLDAEIILLSACNTAYANQSYNETLSGLAASFLAAGAKSLLVSNWAIDSQTTSRLTLEIFKNLINSQTTTPAMALKNAMIKIRKAGLAHPFYWSSITYAGR